MLRELKSYSKNWWSDWYNMLIYGDCLQVLESLLKNEILKDIMGMKLFYRLILLRIEEGVKGKFMESGGGV